MEYRRQDRILRLAALLAIPALSTVFCAETRGQTASSASTRSTQSSGATNAAFAPDATTWATCGLEHVFFAALDVSADGFEDVLTVGADRKVYVAPTVNGWKATGWRPAREEPLPEGLIAFVAIAEGVTAGPDSGGNATGASAGTTTASASGNAPTPTGSADGQRAVASAAARKLLALTPESAFILTGPQLAVERTVAAPAGRRFKTLLRAAPPVAEVEDGTHWKLAGDAWHETSGTPPVGAPNGSADGASAGASESPSESALPSASDEPAPNPPPYQPDAPLARVFTADISGDGEPDPIAVYRMSRYGDYQELRLLVTPAPAGSGRPLDSDADGLSDADEARLGANPRDRDSDDDGLLDGWEVHGLPRGVDTGGAKLSPLRQDVIVTVSPYEQVDRAALPPEMARVAALYQALRTTNPDGSTGLTVHFRYGPSVPADQQHGGSWQEVGNEQLPLRERGLLHWMQVTPGGGGQAAQTGDMGGCGMGFAVFAHEFGHQLGLSHTGDSNPAWCPLYPSLMSYAFSYALDGDANAIRFSDGRFRNTVLLESKLEERLPYPFDEVKYLAAHPFRFKLEADGPNGTRIDWNQNGRFDDEPVSADINYGGSTDCGIRRPLGLIGAGPALAYVGETCWLATLAHEQGGLGLQRYLGQEQWSDRIAIPESGTTTEPLMVGTATHGFVFFRRSLGWYVVRFAPPAPTTQPATQTANPPATPTIDAPVHLTDLPRADLSAGVVNGRVLLIARRDDDSLETYWLDFTDKLVVKRGQALETRSAVPVGFAQHSGDQRVALVSTAAVNSAGAAQCMRVTWCRVAGERLVELETVWTRGEGSGNGCTSRPMVVFDAAGQLNIFHTGGQHGDGSMLVYRTRQIGNRALDEGWLTCLLYDIWTRTRVPIAFASGPQGALYGFRWDADGWTPNNTLLLGYNGFGLNDEPMRDFDDGEKIARYGLVHSILWMQPD